MCYVATLGLVDEINLRARHVTFLALVGPIVPAESECRSPFEWQFLVLNILDRLAARI
jgi:hypothetical protein